MAKKRAESAEAVAAAKEPMPQKYRVSVPGHPVEIVDAATDGEAIARYKERCGIISSDHGFAVECLTPPPEPTPPE